jgi:lipoprotein-releasing system ATP-binding protein
MRFAMSDNSSSVLVSGSELGKTFSGGDGREVVVLDKLTLDVIKHEVVAIVGTSGSGKSTLLQILGGLDRPSSGTVSLEGQILSEMSSEDMASIRNNHIGFVFQFHHLLKDFTAIENVMMPKLIAGDSLTEAKRKAKDLLFQVDLGDRINHKPSELSGGEQQRVAVARALSNEPKLLLADEPTGNLDSKTSEALHQLLFRMRDMCDLTMVIVTHNKQLAELADRVLELRGGRLWDNEKRDESC